jgi:hypothetical protein
MEAADNRFDSFRFALMDSFSSGVFDVTSLIDLFDRVFDPVLRDATFVAPIFSFLRSFDALSRFLGGNATVLKSTIVANFVIAIGNLLRESDTWPDVAKRIGEVFPPGGLLFEMPCDEVSLVLCEVSSRVEATPVNVCREVQHRIAAALSDSNQDRYFEMERIASSMTPMHSTFDIFCSISRMQRLDPDAAIGLTESLNQCLLQSLVAHTQYLFWQFAPTQAAFPRPRRAQRQTDRPIDGTFSMLASECPKLVDELRLLKYRVNRIDSESVTAKTMELIQVAPQYFERFVADGPGQSRLNFEYERLARSLRDLKSYEVPQTTSGEAAFLAYGSRAEISQVLLDTQIVQASLEAADCQIAKLTEEIAVLEQTHPKKVMPDHSIIHCKQAKLRELAQVLMNGPSVSDTPTVDLEQELADLNQENDRLMRQRAELEETRGFNDEDVLHLVILNTKASAARTEGARSLEVECLRGQIASTQATIAKLKQMLITWPPGDGPFDRKRAALLFAGVDAKSATKFMTITLNQLESLISSRGSHPS